MLTFLKFGGPTMGNLGNQCMQLMSLIGLSKRYECDLKLPRWKYSKYFVNPPAEKPNDSRHIDLEEKHFHYDPDFLAGREDMLICMIVNVNGWLQSYKYWAFNPDAIREAFKFNPDFVSDLSEKFMRPTVLSYKQTIAISIRRGDFVGNENYELLPIRYYLMALMEHFPDFRTNYHLIVFSDDIPYCKVHFQCITNVTFTEGLSDIEQLCLLSQCDNFIISNSTFSMVGALLADVNGTSKKIIRPAYNFAGEMAKKNDTKDFWMPHWIRFDHKEQRINLLDVTFVIPVSYDSLDRKQNLDLSLKVLRDNFDTNIIVGEHGDINFSYVADEPNTTYLHFGSGWFHRTKMINDMAKQANTEIVVNWDADIIVPPMQILEAIRLIKEGTADFVYPYDGRFARVPRKQWFGVLDKYPDAGMFGDTVFNGMHEDDPNSVGGCVVMNMQKFNEAGMENEKFISYGPEDLERNHRFRKLDYKTYRIPGVLYHMDHLVTMNSCNHHPHFNRNKEIYEKQCLMSPDELRAEISTWEWLTDYLPAYYDAIHKESVSSRDEVFMVLEQLGILQKGHTIVDVGCGCGSWGFESKYDYVGIDFGVPLDKLVFPMVDYIDHDLREKYPLKMSFDLVLNLENAEHIEEKYADVLIDNLCSLGDTILFSAAIPGQGGVNHHNEQWQSYWAEKFALRGYYPYYRDIRTKLWGTDKVSCWYRQNMVLYCKGYPRDVYDEYVLDVVHPQMFTNIMKTKGII